MKVKATINIPKSHFDMVIQKRLIDDLNEVRYYYKRLFWKRNYHPKNKKRPYEIPQEQKMLFVRLDIAIGKDNAELRKYKQLKKKYLAEIKGVWDTYFRQLANNTYFTTTIEHKNLTGNIKNLNWWYIESLYKNKKKRNHN